MERKTRFTILTFPQNFDGNFLSLNIVFLPRNQNPLTSAIVNDAIPPVIPDAPPAPPFATANLSFTAKILNSLENIPVITAAFIPKIITTAASGDRTPLFNALASQFNIKNLGAANNDVSINAPIINENGVDARKALTVENSVQKYLPLTYRSSFNFTTPVTNAKIDDSYHCALRNKVSNSAFKQSANLISWGQIFAYIMRQPLLAEKAGMIYHAQFNVEETLLNKGGWLYVDLADDSDYKTQQNIDGNFIKNYAARIPALRNGEARTLFAAVQFPVVSKTYGNYDDVFIEASTYDDGFAKIITLRTV